VFLGLRFAFDLFWQALTQSIFWMGTSLLSIVVKIIIVPFAVLIVKVWRQGWQSTWNRAKENLTEAAIATALVWVALVGINAFYVIPHRIKDTNDSLHAPPLRLPSPPDFASAKRLSVLRPEILTSYKIMPFDPPYAPGTVVAGIQFRPRTLDVRFYLSVDHVSAKNIDLKIQLVNTSGQILAIQAMAQETSLPGITVVPVTSVAGIDSVQVTQGGKTSTVPLGGVSSLGNLEQDSDTWRIHCDELLEGTTTEFVLMVSRPYRTAMIEGFRVDGTYNFDADGKPKTTKLEVITKFDDSGKPYAPSQQEVQAIVRYKRPVIYMSNPQINLDGTFPFPPGKPPANSQPH